MNQKQNKYAVIDIECVPPQDRKSVDDALDILRKSCVINLCENVEMIGIAGLHFPPLDDQPEVAEVSANTVEQEQGENEKLKAAALEEYVRQSGMGVLNQLQQLLSVTWDGHLASREDRDHLVRVGLAQHVAGHNFITPEGIQVLLKLNFLTP